jgi:hypothetical protein
LAARRKHLFDGLLGFRPVRDYLKFLRRYPVWWLAPILLYLGAFLWLAGGVAQTPANPFNYSLY